MQTCWIIIIILFALTGQWQQCCHYRFPLGGYRTLYCHCVQNFEILNIEYMLTIWSVGKNKFCTYYCFNCSGRLCPLKG